MKKKETTREEMWAQQNLSATDINYTLWERDRAMLQQLSRISRNCTFVVDVHKCHYAYASTNFVDLLGYDSYKIANVEKQGDYLESRIHPDDRAQLKDLQVSLGQFIYDQPFDERNDYCNLYSFRILNGRQQYVRVNSRHQVLEQDRTGKAWLIMGSMDIAPNQQESDRVDCTVLNLKSGKMFSPATRCAPQIRLTQRETEILQLIYRGLLSKEIADRLCISIHTVNIHRQNLLHKLGVQNSIEAINTGLQSGLLP